MDAKDYLVVALDTNDLEKACALVELLKPYVGMFKIGSALFTAHGPAAVNEILRRAGPPFLDLKFHDTPRSVAGASRAVSALDVGAFTVHALGGIEMMRAAWDGLSDGLAERRTLCANPLIFAVTVLTSHNHQSLLRHGLVSGVYCHRFKPELAARLEREEVEHRVVSLAVDAQAVGLDGVVVSPQEVAAIRKGCGPDFRIAAAGIEFQGEVGIGHRRSGGIGQAIRDGADYIIVGAVVRDRSNPVRIVQGIIAEIAAAMAERG
ncbi:MAG: orotidine-5'-phosphate decarboxylase [Candidatus Sungbacteria bacterium]|uniref:Orotidine 5'-phosphate decarboxylase n=1 Tax=Candidatus Sungiibacteriota bacterium TaxID=2750080 RepID=A0A932YWG6_9BACT|nr:orotidine-5'-phosphate decarboxylase [Candidatus Sungbacteria bacterium]